MSNVLYCGKVNCEELKHGCNGRWCHEGTEVGSILKAHAGSISYCAESHHKRGEPFNPVRIKLVSEFEWQMKMAIKRRKKCP